jgi:hypothetical protein
MKPCYLLRANHSKMIGPTCILIAGILWCATQIYVINHRKSVENIINMNDDMTYSGY